jgi:membrane-bound lytic murein transglycosylase A
MLGRFKLRAASGWLAALLGAAACAGPMRWPAPQAEVAVADDLDVHSLRRAVRHSLDYLEKLPADRVVGEAPLRLTAQQVRDSLAAFDELLDLWHCRACFARALRARFELLPSSADPELSQVLFTGYYQPVMDGSLTPTDRFRYPIYGPPGDLVNAEQVTLRPKRVVERVVGRVQGEEFLPYYSRQEIDGAGALRGRGLEIAWLADPVDVFFLQIQGSGLVRLADGRHLSVGYAAQNGRPYRSIGRLLVERGELSREEVSMQRLRRYLAENPRERDEIFAYNESYVFFRVLENEPLGSLEVPVTAGRSLATDARLFPKGALAWIETEIPIVDEHGRLAGWRPIARFVLNQDTGGAIRGFQRADLYLGTGAGPGALAGYMNRPGRMFFPLLKRHAAARRAGAAAGE